MIEARQKEKYFKSIYLLCGFVVYVNIWRLEVWIVMCYTRDTSEIQSVWKKQKCITQLLLYFYPNTVESRCSQRYAHSGTAFTLWSKVLEYALETESKLESKQPFLWIRKLWDLYYYCCCFHCLQHHLYNKYSYNCYRTLSIVCFKWECHFRNWLMSVSSLLLTDVLTVSVGHRWEALPLSGPEDGDSQLTEFCFVRMPHFNKAREKVSLECSRSSSNKTATHNCFVDVLNDIWQLQQSVVYPLMDEWDDVTWNVQPFHLNRKPLSHSGHLERPNIKG